MKDWNSNCGVQSDSGQGEPAAVAGNGDQAILEALRASERKYRDLVENANSIILYWTRDGRITFLNEFGQRFFGYSEGEILDRHVVGTIVPETESTGRDLRPLMQQIASDPMAFEHNVNENMRRNGERVWISWTNKVAFDEAGQVEGVLSIGTDITEQKRAEAAREAAHELLENIIEFMPDATFVINEDKRVVAWNQACESMTGVAKEAILGKGDYAYAEPFFGERRPMLIDLLDLPSAEAEAFYKYVRRTDDTLYAESFIPRLRGGQGAHLWGAARKLFDQEGRRCGAIETIRDVTEERLIEQALHESESKYRTLFETAGDAIMLMRGSRFLDCNDRTLAMFGCTREQILGAQPFDFSPRTQPDGRLSEESAFEKIKKALLGEPQLFEWEHCRWDKTPFSAEVSLNSLRLGGEVLLQAVVRDVSERKRAESALRESETRYRGLFEDCPTSLWEEDFSEVKAYLDELRCRGITDLNGYFRAHPDALRKCAQMVKVLDVNRATLDLLQYNHREELCAHLSQAFREDSYDLFRTELVHLASGNTFFQTETVNHTRLGDKIYVNMTVAIVPGHEQTWSRVFASFTDISSRVRAEEELRKLNADLEQRVMERTAELALAKERAESADRLKSIFLAAMSHELRTPLNSIIGFTGIVLQGLAGPLNAEQSKQLGMVQGSARHLLALINDVLDLSKIESGQLEVEMKPFDVRQSVEKAVRLITPLAEKKSLTVSARISPGVGKLTGDRRRFEQVLINLLNNGVKFTEKGRVEVECTVEAPNLVIQVTDSGIGIKAEDMDRLFHAFQQIDTGLTRNHEGTGLGLSICKRLVEKMGGRIWAESEWGVGTIFTFTLPLSGV